MSTREFVDTRIYKQFKTKLFTNILAKVISVDNYEEWGMIDVRPCIADVWEEDGSAMAFPVVSNVPVMIYSGGGAVVTIPLAVGDTVTLQVNMRNIDAWKQGDEQEVSVPIDSRMFDLTDSVAVPCVYPKTTSVRPNPNDLELRYNDSIVRLKKDGDITVDTQGNVILIASGNVEVNNEGTNTIVSGGVVTIDTDDTVITGNLRVDGDITVGNDVTTDAGIKLNTHKHVGNLGSPTSPPTP